MRPFGSLIQLRMVVKWYWGLRGVLRYYAYLGASKYRSFSPSIMMKLTPELNTVSFY